MSNSLDPDQDMHSVCKGYLETTKVAASKERVKWEKTGYWYRYQYDSI